MAKELDWQANERIGEIVWDDDDQVVEGVTIWYTRFGPDSSIVIDRSKVDGTVWATVGTSASRDPAGLLFCKRDSVEEAKGWAEKTLRSRLAATNAKLDELSALEQEMGLY